MKSLRSGESGGVPATVEACQNGIQISVIKLSEPDLLEVCITKLISDVCLACGTEWPGHVQVSALDRILEKYWFLNLEEIAYVFRKASDGEYGKVFGQLKVSDLLGWLHDYDIGERMDWVRANNNRFRESEGDAFRELERKEALDLRKKSKEMEKKFRAAKEAKQKVDGQKSA